MTTVCTRQHREGCLTKVTGFHLLMPASSTHWKLLAVWSLFHRLWCWLAKLRIHWQSKCPVPKIHTWNGNYTQPFFGQRNQTIPRSCSTHRNTAAYSLVRLWVIFLEDHFLTGTYGQDGGRINKFCAWCVSKYNGKTYWWNVSKRAPLDDDVGLFSIHLKTKRFSWHAMHKD